MRLKHPKLDLLQAILLAGFAVISLPASSQADANVDEARLKAADAEPQNWFTLGRDGNQTYFSPLSKIDAGNVDRLGFAWSYDWRLPVARKRRRSSSTASCTPRELGAPSTPSMLRPARNYGTSIRRPILARPEIPAATSSIAASPYGRARSSSPRSTATCMRSTPRPESRFGRSTRSWTTHGSYSSTGAVYMAGDVAVIGNSGADMDRGGVRGYVSAYDVDTGALKWRFYTVPGAPGQPYENPELAIADKTWDPRRTPIYKGGGTVWDGFRLRSGLNLLYFGTANAAPYDLRLARARRKATFCSPRRFSPSTPIAAAWRGISRPPRRPLGLRLRAKLNLADLKIDGTDRRVIMQANKNGFFYVLDRETGKLLSAKDYSYVNWASGIDKNTGRPI